MAVAPLMLLPLITVVTFVVRYRRANADDRAAMRWPIAGVALIATLAVTGTLLGRESQRVVTALFLVGAPADCSIRSRTPLLPVRAPTGGNDERVLKRAASAHDPPSRPFTRASR